MNFPLLNISAKKWNSEDLTDYILFNKFIYTKKESTFNELYKDKLFIDCDGRIYKAIKKAELTQKWRNWFRFIPNIWKREILFTDTGTHWSVDELRIYLLKCVSELKTDQHTEKWICDLKRAKNYIELINGNEKTRHNNGYE